MLAKILEFFTGKASQLDFFDTSLMVDKNGEPFRETAAAAIVALLLEAAGADREVAQIEIEAMCIALDDHLAIRGARARDLITAAITSKRDEQKLDQFLNLLPLRLGLEQRQLIFAIAWKIVMADLTLHSAEERLTRRIQEKLRLSNEEADAARRASRA